MAEDAMIYRADHAVITNGRCPERTLTKHEDCHGAATAKGPIPERRCRVGMPLSGTLGIPLRPMARVLWDTHPSRDR